MTDRERDGGRAGEEEGGYAFLPPSSHDDVTPAGDAPTEPWFAELVQDAMEVDGDAVPRELMWARIRQQRRAGVAITGEQAVARFVAPQVAPQVAPFVASPAASRRRFGGRPIVMQLMAVAATLAIGVAIGRYSLPNGLSNGPSGSQVAAAPGNVAGATTVAATGSVGSNDPAVVAMEEHLARTVALLVTVRDESPDDGPGADVSGWARELLGTTRMLLDEPQLREDRTRRLLQDLELVLVQIIQARGTAAPEALRAPSETMRETNLLPRVRAVVTASTSTDESTFRGIAE